MSEAEPESPTRSGLPPPAAPLHDDVPVTRTQVWRLAWPIMVSNLSIPLVGAVDTAVVGHQGDPALIGGVALGAVIFSVLLWGFSFLRMGTTGFVAQSLGAADPTEMTATVGRAVALALILGSALVVLASPLHDLAFSVLEGSAEVESHAGTYFHIRILSAPASLFHYVVLGLLIGIGNTRAALVLQLVLNLSNVAMDVAFVSIAGMGIAGVAIATVIAELLAAAIGVLMMVRVLGAHGSPVSPGILLDFRRLKVLIAANTNIMLRTLGVIGASFWFTAVSARGGTDLLAANAVLLHFNQFAAYGLDGFAHATESLVGRAYGRARANRFRTALAASTWWSVVVAAGYCALFALAGTVIIDMLTGIREVRSLAREFLPWVAAMPLAAVWSYQLDGVYVGCTRTVEMRNGMLIALGVFLVCVEALTALFGNHGLWAAMMVFVLVRALTLGAWLPRILRDIGRRQRQALRQREVGA